MASIPFEFACDKDTGFLMDPNVHKTFGYVVQLNGFGLGATLSPDLQVHIPYNTGAAPTYPLLQYTAPTPEAPVGVAKVVGVMEKWSWNGAVGGPLEVDVWMSQENAFQVKALQQLTLKNTSVTAFAWWIGAYDQETKVWYEASYALGSGLITGIINGQDGNMDLDVDLSGAQAAAGIDVMVYKVSIKIVPAANQQYTFHMANSSSKKTVKSWGLVVGTLAASAVPTV
jgi:hypothetical protein